MRKVITILAVFLVLTCSAFSQVIGQGVSDDLTRKIEKKIQKDKRIQIDDLKVLHDGDKILLSGTGHLLGSRYQAEKIALKEKGVKEVDNQIDIIPAEVSDLDIKAELIPKIRKHVRGTPFDLISLEVKHGFVTLTGYVRDTTLVDEAMEEAVWIRGVRGVENKIKMATITSGDERLRRAIYDRLNREYPQYFSGTYPNILILVDGGRVTLVGTVDSSPTRERIGSRVRSIHGVLSVENLLETN